MDCVYVTRGWGIHDERWTAALRDLGHEPATVSLAPGDDAAATIRELFAQSGPMPVLAGPLNTVTRDLVGLDTRLVGLSWGFDLHELADAGELAWLSRLDALLVDSEATRAIAMGAGVRGDRITLLPWGIDIDTFRSDGPATTAAELGLPVNSKIVLSLRAHEELYRVADIVEAFVGVQAVIPDARLVIGHAGSQTDLLRARVDELGLADAVAFIGTVAEPDLARLLRGAACYVTAASVDGTSVTLLQAMACGTPVVASATPGNLGWISPGQTGRVFPTADVPALTASIVEALTSRDDDLVRRASELVRSQADWARNIERLEAAMFPAPR